MQNKRLTNQKSLDHPTVKKRNLFIGTIIAVFLIISPYIFYQYMAFPDELSMETPFGIYRSAHYGSIQTMAWVLFQKIIPLFLLFIWFFTCKHWWYHAILVPICMLSFQTYSVLNDDLKFSDSNEFFILAPLVLVMLIFSYTIRMRVFDKIHGIDFSELSRGNWKGEIATPTEDVENEDDDEDEDEPIFMHY